MDWVQLMKKYEKDGIVLVLGAGVSMASGLPNWEKLLQRLLFNNGKADNNLFDDLQNRKISLPSIASFIEGKCASREEFIEKVREALYIDFRSNLHAFKESNSQNKFVSFIQQNLTLRTVASFCAIRNPDKTYSPNRKVHAIVTFNIDGLLQKFIFERYGARLLRTRELPSASANPNKISLYFMHGFLRFDEKAGKRNKESKETVVLTEQDYFDFFNEPTSMFNSTFLYLLREYTCVFIGLSMKDENIRRLLHYTTKEMASSLKKEGKDPQNEKMKMLPHCAILKKESEETDNVIENTIERLGTSVLWLDDFSKIPYLLKEIYKSTGDNWEAVY